MTPEGLAPNVVPTERIRTVVPTASATGAIAPVAVRRDARDPGSVCPSSLESIDGNPSLRAPAARSSRN